MNINCDYNFCKLNDNGICIKEGGIVLVTIAIDNSYAMKCDSMIVDSEIAPMK